MTGGNWANNILNGPGAPPTTIAAFFIPATPLPTVTTDTAELRLNGRYTITKAQSLRVAYTYLRMTIRRLGLRGHAVRLAQRACCRPTNSRSTTR